MRRRLAVVCCLATMFPWIAAAVPVSALQTTWSAAPSPNVGAAGNNLTAVSCASPASCAAVGYRLNPNGIRRTLIEMWDGTTWSVVTSPSLGSRHNSLYGVSCASTTRCVAVGSELSGSRLVTLTETWNGTSWSVAPSANPGAGDNELVGVSCPSTTTCVAIGYFDGVSGSLRSLAERWNGTAWTAMHSLNPVASDVSLNSVSCATTQNCVAVGYSDNGSGTVRILVEKWNGTAWSVVPTPNPASSIAMLNGVSCVSTVRCVAVGWFGTPFTHPLVETWNGSTWTATTGLGSLTYFNDLQAITCSAYGHCIAVGSTFDGNNERKFVETLAHSTWTRTSTPNVGGGNSALTGVSCGSSTGCVAVGDYATGTVATTLVLSAVVDPDVTAPTVYVSSPADGAGYVVGQPVVAAFACADETGGWGLVSCVGTVASGKAIDTATPGTKSFSVTATDGGGNVTTKTLSYTVGP